MKISMIKISSIAAIFCNLVPLQSLAWSFSSGSSNYPNQPYITTPLHIRQTAGYVSPYNRFQMRVKRQEQMEKLETAMHDIGGMIYGTYPFDIAKAQKQSQFIEANSGKEIWKYYHPNAIAADDSRASPNFWGNEENFKQQAEQQKIIATQLRVAIEAMKDIDLNTIARDQWKHYKFHNTWDNQIVAVPYDVFYQYEQLANTCHKCHAVFRGPRWE